MLSAKLFLYTTFFICSVIVIKQLVGHFQNRGKLDETEATIIDIILAGPETMVLWNSKRAILEYYVKGRRITSKNMIFVSMNNEIGDKIQIKYFIDDPKLIYTGSIKRLLIALGVGLLSLYIVIVKI